MLAGGLNYLRALQAVSAVKRRQITGKLMTISRAGGRTLKLRGVKEYADGRAVEFEELRLARLFHRYLKLFIREKILRLPANRPFTEVMKDGVTPLRDTGAMVEKFVYIRKLERGYRVGFNVSKKYNNRLTLGQLLGIIEKGTQLDRTPTQKAKIRAYIWSQLDQKGLKGPQLPTVKHYIIKPRPFFDKLVEKFTLHNRGERRVFTKGVYSLHIRISKPVVRRYAEDVKKTKNVFTETYG